MFPFQQEGELVDHHQDPLQDNSTTPYWQLQQQTHQDLFFINNGHRPPLVTTNDTTNINYNVMNNDFYNNNNLENEDNSSQQIYSDKMIEYKLKKVEHRDIERKRRQEMATLQASLQSLLPLDFNKEKSTISDHMHQAAKYIKHLQSNIKSLHAKRDELKLSGNSGSEEERKPELNSPNPAIIINQFDGGLEILISANVKENDSLLSPHSVVLSALMEERAYPISCISHKENGGCFWRIQCEVNDKASFIEVSELQRKISDLMITNFI